LLPCCRLGTLVVAEGLVDAGSPVSGLHRIGEISIYERRWSAMSDFANKVGFAIGTGRCGTVFLYEVMQQEPDVASSHERNPENEAFHRYCKWHRLPVDSEGFLSAMEKEIRADLAQKAYSFEASPYLSLSVKELHERFGARFVMLVRKPDGVVSSFLYKGFYRRPYAVADVDLAAGYQDQSPERFFTFFARVSPRGEFLRTWNQMTQIGRVAWFWRAFNERTLESLEQLPKDAYRIVRIEDLDHAGYLEMCRFLGVNAKLPEAQFETLRESKPHAFWRKRSIDKWTAQEIEEFEGQVADMARHFGYRYHIAELVEEARAEREENIRLGRVSAPGKGPRLWRVRKATASWLRGLATSVDAS
jgi:hypothetical protein